MSHVRDDHLWSEAVVRLIPEARTQASIRPTQIIDHSAVDARGPSSLFGFFANPRVQVETHTFIKWNGECEQYMPFNIRADGNRRANRRPDGTGAISVETEDDGDPNTRPWSDAQLETMKQLKLDCSKKYGIPLRVCRHPADPGLGHHTLFGAPSDWTPSRGKTCPGVVRKTQWPWHVIDVARTAAGIVPEEEPEMAEQSSPTWTGWKNVSTGVVIFMHEPSRQYWHAKSHAFNAVFAALGVKWTTVPAETFEFITAHAVRRG